MSRSGLQKVSTSYRFLEATQLMMMNDANAAVLMMSGRWRPFSFHRDLTFEWHLPYLQTLITQLGRRKATVQT